MSTKLLKSISPQNHSEDNDFVSIHRELEPNEEEVNYGSDEEISHSKLIKDISLLSSTNQKSFKWKATRFESKSDVNEFNLSQSKYF
jgi:hypothetical protein